MQLSRIYKFSLVILLALCCSGSYAQDSLSLETTDQKSLRLYNDKSWEELIKLGKQAINEGSDYYFLRMRIGIAYYEKKNYNLAEVHFKRALEFNSTDELALEYLYYSYYFVGKYEEARILSKGFSKELSEKTGITKQNALEFVLVEGGTKQTDSSTYYEKSKKTNSNYFNPAAYFQLGVKHYIKNRASFFHAFTYFNQQTFLGTTTQKQYYLKSSVALKNNWQISPAIHLVNLNYTVQRTILPQPNQFPPGPPPQPKTQTIVTKSNYFIGSLSVQKNYRKLTLSVGSTFSNMSDKNQYLHSAFASYAVFGNSKLVIGLTEYIHTNDDYKTVNSSYIPFIYAQPINKLSIKVSYLNNIKNNIIEENGYLVNNSPDLTKNRFSILANVTINKHLSIYGLYQLESKQEVVQLFNYRYNVIVGGIKISP